MLRRPLAVGGSPPGDDWKDGRDLGKREGRKEPGTMLGSTVLRGKQLSRLCPRDRSHRLCFGGLTELRIQLGRGLRLRLSQLGHSRNHIRPGTDSGELRLCELVQVCNHGLTGARFAVLGLLR